jgi:outer membrane protein OmpA-like peptidoglycan-associated protein
MGRRMLLVTFMSLMLLTAVSQSALLAGPSFGFTQVGGKTPWALLWLAGEDYKETYESQWRSAHYVAPQDMTCTAFAGGTGFLKLWSADIAESKIPKFTYGGSYIYLEGDGVDNDSAGVPLSLTWGFINRIEAILGVGSVHYPFGMDTRPVGDVKLGAKFRVIGEEAYAFGLAVLGYAVFPVGEKDDKLQFDDADFGFAGAISGRLWPDSQYPIGYMANVGHEITAFEDDDDMTFYGAGLEFPWPYPEHWPIVSEDTYIDVQFLGNSVEDEESGDSPMEIMPGVRHVLGNGATFGAGWSFGLTYASPDWEIIAYLCWPLCKVNADRDGDGILDADDECPDDPEDYDGYMDYDGCPDPDNDGDGILDIHDECPDDPEDFDNFEDKDGCPDPDNDGDGILDVDDECPNEPEDFDGIEDSDGCPDLDFDGDGIDDADDACPKIPENFNGFEDEDGCPELSPDLSMIFFDVDRTNMRTASVEVLSKVAEMLKMDDYSGLKLRLEGHTDNTFTEEYNMDLSMRRAESTMKYLVSELGVDAGRISIAYFGETQPRATNDTPEGRQDNRRVALKLLMN